MRIGLRGALITGFAAAALWMPGPALLAQTEGYTAPRSADGRPDLNGIWQALNTANYDIEAHTAKPALALIPAPSRADVPGIGRSTPVELPAPGLRALGAVGAVPAGEGLVVGGDIPYQSWAAAMKQENAEHWLERDPEIKCFMPGVPRATYMPYPFQILQEPTRSLSLTSSRVRRESFTWTRWETARVPPGWDGRAGVGRATRS